MRNRYLERMNRIIKIKVVGSNIHNYLKRISKYKVQIIKLIPVSYREVYLILKESEYQKLLQIHSIYEISIVEYYGKLKLYKLFRRNVVLLVFMVLGFFLMFFLSRMVFSVEVIHQDSELRELIEGELKKHEIDRFTLKKSYHELEKIEDQILADNKDRLEWIEIISYGTKYTVRVEERKLNQEEKTFQYQSIVSKKSAVIVEIDAVRGEKVKQVNDYVKAGDVVISGYITLPNNTKVATMAEGKVYGEVWYEVNVDYPFVYQESKLTGRSKTVYVLHFFNKRIGLFDFEAYRSFESKDKILVSSNLLSLKLTKEKQYESVVKDEVYTEDIVEIKAIDYIKDKLMKDNLDIVKIEEVKVMSRSGDEDSISFRLFVRAIEDIGQLVPISEILEEKIDVDE